MKRSAFTFILCAILVISFSPHAGAIDLNLPLPPSPGEVLETFHKAAGDFFGFEDPVLKQVVKLLPDEELPVVLFLAEQLNMTPRRLAEMHRGGMSWMDISLKFGRTADIFYVPVDTGPPYGKAWGHYKRPKHQWKQLRLSDAEIVDLVNLRFISGHYGYAPSEVMKMRDRGEGFVQIHEKARGRGKSKVRGSGNGSKGQGGGSGNSKGKGKGKDKWR